MSLREYYYMTGIRLVTIWSQSDNLSVITIGICHIGMVHPARFERATFASGGYPCEKVLIGLPRRKTSNPRK